MIGTTLNNMLSDDEKKFVAFWALVFASAIGFWIIAVRWAAHLLAA